LIIPESTIQRIIDEADIVKIISEYIKLEKKSSNFVGLCPFHPDQHPSLHVSPTKKIFKCFSCGEAGNVISFVAKYEKVSFPRAVQIVGEKCGINVNLGISESQQISNKYYKILEDSAEFYHFLLENTVSGKEAKKYLYKRNLNDEIIKRFKIGVSPNEPDLLYKSLLASEHQPLDMIEAGVVRSTNPYTDVFRNRIMFPLEDINGRIVGFSGRIYHDEGKEEPKYLNSAENKIFKKGNLLYNFSKAIPYIKSNDYVFIFEGFMDVIAAYRSGIYNAVATMGTSISNNQINTIKKMTNNVVICYDGDNPGIDATKKAIFQLLNAGFNVSSILLPNGLDPDEYINEYGIDKLTNLLLKEQISGYDYLYETAKFGLDLNNINDARKFTTEIFTYLKYFNSNIITEKFLKKIASDLNISYDSLALDFQKQKNNLDFQEISFPKNTENNISSLEIFISKGEYEPKKYINASECLLALAYYSKEDCKKIKNKLGDFFIKFEHYSLLATMYEFYKRNDILPSDFFNSLSEEEKNILNTVLAKTSIPESDIDKEKLLDDCIETVYSSLDHQYSKDLKSEIITIADEEIKKEKLELFRSLKKPKVIKKKE